MADRKPDRHKRRPIPFRPPEQDETWLRDYAASTGCPVNALLTEALRAFREQRESGESR